MIYYNFFSEYFICTYFTSKICPQVFELCFSKDLVISFTYVCIIYRSNMWAIELRSKWMHFGSLWSIYEKRTKRQSWLFRVKISRVKHQKWSTRKIQSFGIETKKSTLGLEKSIVVKPGTPEVISSPKLKTSKYDPSMKSPNSARRAILCDSRYFGIS